MKESETTGNGLPAIGWQVAGWGRTRLLIELRQQMTAEQYDANKRALQDFLCGYFSSGDCNQALGDSISPLKATDKGGKVLKVRWALPGSGKSGSLRLVVVAYSSEPSRWSRHLSPVRTV